MTDFPARRKNLDATERLLEPERVKHASAVRADLDAGTHLLELDGLLVHLDIEAAPQQRERRGEPANAAADDHDHSLVRSIALDAGRLHDCRPARKLFGDEGREIPR